MTEIKPEDEYLHEPNERPDWRESYYFNWVDRENEVSGFSTIGVLPNISKREFVFALFHDDTRDVYFVEPEGAVPEDTSEALSDGKLSFQIGDPLKDWTIRFDTPRLKAEIVWTGRFDPCDFGAGSGTSWAGHYEQSGRAKGWFELEDGGRVAFEGLGQRDKSWGARDWHIERWFALHAQFKNLSIGLRQDIVDGKAHSSGAITTENGHVPIEKIEVSTVFAEEPIKMPTSAITIVFGEDGSKYTLKSKMLTENSFVRFARDFPGGETELYEEMGIHECTELDETGTGLIEWLFTHR